MADGEVSLTEVLPPGVSVVRHWGFFLDNLPYDFGGGYAAGEFLFRGDGVLLSRGVIDSYSGDLMRYKATGPWRIFHRFPAETDATSVATWLGDRRY